MNTLKQAAMAMVLVMGTVGLAEAHHAANSQFDGNRSLIFTGVLSKVDLGNPHSYLYFMRMQNGQQQTWTFEAEAIGVLRRAGLSARQSLLVGTTYSLVYSPSLDGSPAGLMSAIKLSDGRIINALAKDQQVAAKALLSEKLLNGTQSGQQ